MNDRYSRRGSRHDFDELTPGREFGRGFGDTTDYGPGSSDYRAARDYGAGQDYGYSSARDFAAAGQRSGGQRRDPGRNYGGDSEYRGSYWPDGHRTTEGSRGAREPRRGDDRGFFDRAGDEVRSWFGDEEAEHRREQDERRWQANHPDAHYSNWRRSRIEELDRDYDEYRRENATKFENEFNSWRGERQSQREGLKRASEHMEVVGSDGDHLGTVDKVRGDRILLTKSDPEAGGHHHSIPSRWIKSVDERVTLSVTAEQARNQWRDEERGALGWEREEQRTNLNRAFSGTY